MVNFRTWLLDMQVGGDVWCENLGMNRPYVRTPEPKCTIGFLYIDWHIIPPSTPISIFGALKSPIISDIHFRLPC